MNENAKKWVEALRSGEFKQTTQTLQDAGGYCCLGIAAVVYERETGESLPRDSRGHFTHAELGSEFDCVRNWLELSDSIGMYSRKAHRTCLVRHNDDDGMNFSEIADIIESEPEGLFK